MALQGSGRAGKASWVEISKSLVKAFQEDRHGKTEVTSFAVDDDGGGLWR